jgi:transcriptional regulator with XRE-family HTH domain
MRLNQSELAKAIGVTRATVSFWERGDIKKIEATNLSRLCKKLRVSSDYILYGTGPGPTPANLPTDEELEDETPTKTPHMTDDRTLQLLDDLTTTQREAFQAMMEAVADMNTQLHVLRAELETMRSEAKQEDKGASVVQALEQMLQNLKG